MTNKEALLFVGKCLSLSMHPECASSIKATILSGQIDWRQVVYQSSAQFVLPALYLNLKRNNLLSDLPEDLVAHFEEITNLNRERNQSIIKQLNNINALLNENGLKPVFLKGTAHLLDGLYEDIGERMIGDIDFLLEENEALQAFNILKENGYYRLSKIGDAVIGAGRHLPRLINENEIAAVEVHGQMLKTKQNYIFNWLMVEKNLKEAKNLKDAFVLSDNDLILNNMLNVLLNDKGKSMLKIFLRQNYDLLLLSKRENPSAASRSFNRNHKDLNAYIALSAHLFDYPATLNFEENTSAKHYLQKINFVWDYPRLARFGRLIYFIFFRIYRYFVTLIGFFVSSSTRKRVIASLSDPTYYGKHFEQYKVWFS